MEAEDLRVPAPGSGASEQVLREGDHPSRLLFLAPNHS